MRGEEAAAVLPEERPDLLTIGLWERKGVHLRAGKKGETSLAMRWRNRSEAWLHLEQEHEPVGLSLVAVLADESGEVQVSRCEGEADFLVGFATSTGIGRLASLGVELAAAGTPESAVGFLRAFEQEHVAALIETVEERGDLVGQRHARSEAGRRAWDKRAGKSD